MTSNRQRDPWAGEPIGLEPLHLPLPALEPHPAPVGVAEPDGVQAEGQRRCAEAPAGAMPPEALVAKAACALHFNRVLEADEDLAVLVDAGGGLGPEQERSWRRLRLRSLALRLLSTTAADTATALAEEMVATARGVGQDERACVLLCRAHAARIAGDAQSHTRRVKELYTLRRRRHKDASVAAASVTLHLSMFEVAAGHLATATERLEKLDSSADAPPGHRLQRRILLAVARQRAGRQSEAEAMLADVLARPDGELSPSWAGWLRLRKAHAALADRPEAEPLADLQAAAELFEQADPQGPCLRERAALARLRGWVALRHRTAADAREHFEQALELARQAAAADLLAHAWLCLGAWHARLNDLPQALGAFEQARELFEAAADPLGEGSALSWAGRVHMGLGDLAAAEEACEGALSTFREREAALSEANVLRHLASLDLRRARRHRAKTRCEQASTMCASLQSRSSQAAALTTLGEVLTHSNELSEAERACEQALALSRDVEDRLGQVDALRALADLKARCNDLQTAQKLCHEALPLYAALDAPLGQANTRVTLGILAQRMGEPVAAQRNLEEALQLYRRVRDRLGEANATRALGDLFRSRSDLRGARRAYDEALSIYRSVKDLLGEANVTRGLGDLHMLQDDTTSAETAYGQALSIYRDIDDPLGEANALKSLGDLRFRNGDFKGAADLQERVLFVFRSLRDRLGEANTLRVLGDLRMHTDGPVTATKLYERALALYRASQDVLGEASIHQALGSVRMRAGDLAEAERAFRHALTLCRRIQDRLGEANALTNLGDVRFAAHDIEAAQEAYEEAATLFGLSQDRLGQANVLHKQGALALARDDAQTAHRRLRRALAEHAAVRDVLGVGADLDQLGKVECARGRHRRAALYGESALTLFRSVGERWGEYIVLKGMAEALLGTGGNVPGGLACLNLALQLGQQVRAPDTKAVTARRAQLLRSLRQQQTPQAQLLCRLAERLAEGLRTESVRLLLGDPALAVAFFDDQCTVAAMRGRLSEHIEALAGQAIALAGAGQRRAAVAAYAQAEQEAKQPVDGDTAPAETQLAALRAGLEVSADEEPFADLLQAVRPDADRIRRAGVDALIRQAEATDPPSSDPSA